MAEKGANIRNTLVYLIPLIVGSLTPIITLPVFTRILTVEDYGLLALSQAYAIFVSGLACFGAPVAYERNFFEFHDVSPARSAALLYTTIAFVAVNHVVLIALSMMLLKGVTAFLSLGVDSGPVILCCLFAQMFQSIVQLFMTYFKNAMDAVKYAGYTIAASLLNLSFSLVFVAVVGTGVVGIPLGQSVSIGIVIGLLALRFWRRLPFHWDWRVLTETIRIGFPLTPKVFIGVLNTQFDKYMIGVLSSLGGAGVYEVGQRLARAVFLGMNALQNVFSPGLYQHMFRSGDGGGVRIGPYLTPFAYFSFAMALLAALFAEEAVRLLCHPTFSDATEIVTLLSVFYGLLFFNKVAGNQITYTKNTYLTTLLVLASTAINIGLNIPFIVYWGAFGAAWATLLAGILSGVLTVRVAHRLFPLDWEYGRLAVMLALLMAGALGCLMLRFFDPGYGVRLSFKFAVVLGYVLAGVQFKVLSIENMQTALRVLGPRAKSSCP